MVWCQADPGRNTRRGDSRKNKQTNEKTAFRKIPYGLFGVRLATRFSPLFGIMGEAARTQVAGSLQDCWQIPPSHRAGSLSMGIPLITQKDKMSLLVPIYTLHWPAASSTDDANNKECQTRLQSRQKTL